MASERRGTATRPGALTSRGIQFPVLTSSNLLTLGIAQASLTLLSLNRKFQHDNMHSLSKLGYAFTYPQFSDG